MPYAPSKVCPACRSLVPAGARCSCLPPPKPYVKLERCKHYGTAEWKRTAAAYREHRRGICEACGAAGARDVDHRIPRSRGGTDDFSNLQLLCHGCHSTKTGRERKGQRKR